MILIKTSGILQTIDDGRVAMFRALRWLMIQDMMAAVNNNRGIKLTEEDISTSFPVDHDYTGNIELEMFILPKERELWTEMDVGLVLGGAIRAIKTLQPNREIFYKTSLGDVSKRFERTSCGITTPPPDPGTKPERQGCVCMSCMKTDCAFTVHGKTICVQCGNISKPQFLA